MAASGIAEHHEARRRQMQVERRAFRQKMLMDTLEKRLNENPDLLDTQPRQSYDSEVEHLRKMGSPPGIDGPSHDAASVDRNRRDQLRRQQMVEYSAKLPKRFNSGDYISQW